MIKNNIIDQEQISENYLLCQNDFETRNTFMESLYMSRVMYSDFIFEKTYNELYEKGGKRQELSTSMD